MRVTQSMLSSNMLRNLSASYSKMGKLQEQMTTGKKVNRPSDDPVAVMKGMGYRVQVDKVMQFKRNLGEVNNYLDSTDDALTQVGSTLKRANELMVNASTGSMTQEDREAILEEIKQLRETAKDLANTKTGEKHIFSGTKTGTPLHDKTEPIPPDLALPGRDADGYPTVVADTPFEKEIKIEVFDGVTMTVNTDAMQMFKEIDKMFADIETAIEAGESPELGKFITSTQEQMDKLLMKQAEVGALQNRAEMMDNRLGSQEGIVKKQMSQNEDVEIEVVITEMVTQEALHRAALSVGAKIIQPSLVDFLR